MGTRQRILPQVFSEGIKYAYLRVKPKIYYGAFIFLLTIIFIYLALAAQFESFIDPFIILLTVPTQYCGHYIAYLKLIFGTLNIYTDIELVTLIGLISKHGILIIQFANRL